MPEEAVARLTFPELLTAAETASAEQQRHFYLVTGLQLGVLAAAAVASLIPDRGAGSLGPFVTLSLFLAALLLQVSGLAARTEKRWYDARAAAESIKSAAWEYAVCGESFRADDAKADARFVDVLKRVLEGLRSLDIGAATAANASATASMKELRASEQSERRAIYLRDRVEDQVRWYSAKSGWNKRRSQCFTVTAIAVETAAVLFGILRVMGSVGGDVLGALAACAAGLIGWTQAKKYSSLAEVYAVTSHEVGLVSSTLGGSLSEEAWAQAIHDAEAAFSREHTMWQARRQGPV
jgi:hypothetical protein